MNVTPSLMPRARSLPDGDDAAQPPADADGQPDDLADSFDADLDQAAPAQAPGRAGPCACAITEPQLVDWIDAIVERDERALTALYDATLSRVYGLVLHIVRRPGLAEEVVEDTYFQVWRQAVRFDPGRGRALTWLLGMARSRAIDTLRREARFQHDNLDADAAAELDAAARPVDELLDLAQGHAALHGALLGLNAQPRQLVALAFFRGLSHEEIASQTALPLGTVKSQIRRALITLRERLGDSGGHMLAA